MEPEKPINILCLCPTYRQPERLKESIACFLHQYYPAANRRLLVVDTAMEILPQKIHREWTLLNRTERSPSLPQLHDEMIGLGQKVFNKQVTRDEYHNGKKIATEMILEEWVPEAYVLWNEDSLYLSGYLGAVARSLGSYKWSMSNSYLVARNVKGKPLVTTAEGQTFNGSLAFRHEFITGLGGFAEILSPKVRAANYGNRIVRAFGEVTPGYPLQTVPEYVQFGGTEIEDPDDESWYLNAGSDLKWPAEQIHELVPGFSKFGMSTLRTAQLVSASCTYLNC